MAQERTTGPRTGETRFAAYLEAIAAVLGDVRRAASARAYCAGLLLPGERKSIEPMAARIEPDRVQAKHQSLHHVIAKAEWDDAAVLATVRAQVLPAIERHGPIAYWIIDDTSFPKQGPHSVGVARQYCGQLGKQDNCQVAVSLSVANDHASLPITYRLYLPETWAEDPVRCAKAGVPEEIIFETKTAIALAQLRQALADGVPVGTVLGDAGYGDETEFRVGAHAEQVAQAGHDGLAARHRPAAARTLVRPRTPAEPVAAWPREPAGRAQAAGREPAATCLAHGHVARGDPDRTLFALRRPSDASGAPRHPALRALAGRVAADRVARRRG